MKNKKILLINDNYPEAITLQKALDQLNVDYTLHVARNGKDALDILMGSSSAFMENYTRTGKVQPDIILLNKNLSDMSGFEFLEIMRKYYSLKNIKVFLLTTSVKDVDQKFTEKFAIAGYLPRPFEINQNTFGSFNKLKSELSASRTNLALIPLTEIKSKFAGSLKFLKAKAMIFNMGQAASVKIAACAISVVTISGMVAYIGKSQTSQSLISSEAIVETNRTPGNKAAETLPESNQEMNEGNASEIKPVESRRAKKGSDVKKSDPVSKAAMSDAIIEKEPSSSLKSIVLSIRVVEESENTPH